MTEGKTNNLNLDLIQDSDSLKAAVKTKPNANLVALDALEARQDAEIARSWREGVNFSPFFSAPLDSGYWDKVPSESDMEDFGGTIELLADGWVRLSRETVKTANKSLIFRPSIISKPKVDETYTLLVEYRNNIITAGTVYISSPQVYGSTTLNGKVAIAAPASASYIARMRQYQSSDDPSGENLFNRFKGQVSTGNYINSLIYFTFSISSTFTGSIEFRLSLYEGDYQGSYVPYDFDQPSTIKKRVKDLEISQAEQDTEIALAWKDDEQPNLHPFLATTDREKYLVPDSDSNFMSLPLADADGWTHVNSSDPVSGTGYIFDMIKIGFDIEAGSAYTLLVELKNVVAEPNNQLTIGISDQSMAEYLGESLYCTDETSFGWYDISSNGSTYIPLAGREGDHDTAFWYVMLNASGTATSLGFECDVRFSLYKGEYQGDYVPYNPDTPTIMKQRVADLEASQATQDTEIAKAWKVPGEGVNLHPFFDTYLPIAFMNLTGFNYHPTCVNGTLTLTSLTGGTISLSGMPPVMRYPSPDEKLTLMIEISGLENTGITSNIIILQAVLKPNAFTYALQDGKNYIQLEKNAGGLGNGLFLFILNFNNTNAGDQITVRMSLYTGNYDGDYVAFDKTDPARGMTLGFMENQHNFQRYIRFESNGGAMAPTGSLRCFGGQDIKIPTGVPTRTGYTFSSWNTSSDGSGTSYSPGDTFTPSGASVDLYAQWTAN